MVLNVLSLIVNLTITERPKCAYVSAEAWGGDVDYSIYNCLNFVNGFIKKSVLLCITDNSYQKWVCRSSRAAWVQQIFQRTRGKSIIGYRQSGYIISRIFGKFVKNNKYSDNDIYDKINIRIFVERSCKL